MKKSELRQLIREEIVREARSSSTMFDHPSRSIPKPRGGSATLPSSIEDVTMTMLHTGMNKAVIKKLDDIKKRTGSNSNPISMQVIEAWDEIGKLMRNKANLKGPEAVSYFLMQALKEFNDDFSFIRTVTRKYKIRDARQFARNMPTVP